MHGVKQKNSVKLGKIGILVGSFLGAGVSTTLYAQDTMIGFMQTVYV